MPGLPTYFLMPLPIDPAAAALLCGAALAAALAALRRDALAGQVVAFAAVAALVLILRTAAEVTPAAAFGRPLAGAAVLGLFGLAAHRVLTDARGLGAAFAALAASTGASVGALLASDLLITYGLATLAVATAWLAVLIDPTVGPVGARAAGAWTVALLIADLGLLAAALLAPSAVALTSQATATLASPAAIGLAIAGAVRLMLFPFHPLPLGQARLPGRATFALQIVGGLLGTGLLLRTVGAYADWLLWGAAATAIVGVLLLPQGRQYRDGLSGSSIVDAAHVAAGLAVATPLGVAAAILYALNAALARTTLLAIADAANPGSRQLRRLPDGPALIPFGLGFGALVGMPPQPGFVARWLLLLALFETGAWPVALLLWLAASVLFAELLRQVGRLGPPANPGVVARPLLVGLGLLWLPLGLFVVAPIVALGSLIAPAVALALPEALDLGVERLLDVTGVVALLLAFSVVVVGFAVYVGRIGAPTSWLAGPVRRMLVRCAAADWPQRTVESLGVLLGEAVAGLTRPWEVRFNAVGILAVALTLLLLALG